MTREEAIKIIRDNIPHLGIGATQMTEALGSLVPELRESEDERIRKEIVECIETLIKQPGASPRLCDWLAWLEKQKEQKPNYCHYGGDPSVERCKYCSAACSARLTEEQKPAEKQDYSGLNDLERAIHRGFLSAGIENVPVTIIKETAKECLAQQKPAWSEKDEKIMQTMIKEGDLKPSEIAWLKSLRPPQYCENCKLKKSVQGWKPSEEQIYSLGTVVKGSGECSVGSVGYNLKELYEQLKKL